MTKNTKEETKQKKSKKEYKPMPNSSSEVAIPILPTSLSEELEALLKKNPKHFYGCGG